MFDKIFSLFKKWTSTKELWKIIWEKFIENYQNHLEQLKADYFNPHNYPLYHQEYYKLIQEFDNYNTIDDLDNFYAKVNDVFDKLKLLYEKTDLEEKEKTLLFYKDDKKLNFYFFDTYYKLLRKIWNKYKKLKAVDKSFELFQQIVLWAIRDIEKMPELFDTMRVNDVKFLIKEYWKRWDIEAKESMEDLEKTIIEKTKNDQIVEETKIKEDYKKRTQENFYRNISYFKYKRSSTQNDDDVCEICRENEEKWWIKINDYFPSWQLFPPFHDWLYSKWEHSCRCNISYSNSKKD